MSDQTFSNPNRPQHPAYRSQPIDFVKLLPSIRRQANKSFVNLNPDAREEAVQEVVANSFATYRRLIERGKTEVIAPKPLARFAIAQTRTGRQVGGHLNCHDVSSRYCRNRQGIELQSLNQIDTATGSWKQILVEDPSSTPADIVAIRLDFQSWLNTLSPRNRRIAETLSTGETTLAAAKLFKVAASRISQLRSELKAAWEAFHGTDCRSMLASA